MSASEFGCPSWCIYTAEEHAQRVAQDHPEDPLFHCSAEIDGFKFAQVGDGPVTADLMSQADLEPDGLRNLARKARDAAEWIEKYATVEVVCPEWCASTPAQHSAELGDWDGYVIHWTDRDADVRLSASALPDGTIDPSEAPRIWADVSSDGVSVEAAAEVANEILRLVAEVAR